MGTTIMFSFALLLGSVTPSVVIIILGTGAVYYHRDAILSWFGPMRLLQNNTKEDIPSGETLNGNPRYIAPREVGAIQDEGKETRSKHGRRYSRTHRYFIKVDGKTVEVTHAQYEAHEAEAKRLRKQKRDQRRRRNNREQ